VEKDVADLFFTGLALTPLVFFSVQPLADFFRKKGRGYALYENSRVGAAFSVLFLIAGTAVSLFSSAGALSLAVAYCLGCVGLAAFEIFLFLTLYYTINEEEIGRFPVVLLGAAGLLAVFLPVILRVSPSWFLGGFSLLLVAVMAVLVFPAGNAVRAVFHKARAGGPVKKPACQSVFLVSGAEILLIALSFFVRVAGAGVFLRAAPVVFFLIHGERLFTRPKGAGDAVSNEVETILENADSGAEDLPVLEGADDTVSGRLLNPFVPKEFLNIIGKENVRDLRLSDHAEREMTIFFSDIRDFTSLLESLTPEQSINFINSYLTRIVPVIEAHGGFVDKYIGDAIMALFPQKDGPDKAVQSAIEIQKKLVEYNEQRKKYNYRPISMGIGIHTGMVMLGVVGIYTRMQNTVFSDSVNLASRVETLTKAFRISVAISGQTFQKLEDSGSYKYRFLGKVRVKGKGEPTSVFEIIDETEKSVLEKKMQTDRFFQEGLMSFMQKKYEDAIADFEKVLEILPDDEASILYRETCKERILMSALSAGEKRM
jgi:two-component system sensor histidine kinase ChiS